MRESADYSNWFTRFEDELPSLEDLTPLSQTLITPDLALAFDISTHAPPHEFNSPEPSSGHWSGNEPARTLKRPRLVWTPQLHKRFVDAVAQLGIRNAVPKTIMQLMSVDGLTRENVASHLQKYRLYLRRVQGVSVSPTAGVLDPATDRLFASAPVPAQFLLHPAPAVGNHHARGIQVVWPYGHFGNSPPQVGGFDLNNPFLGPHRMGMTPPASVGRREVLTLFPTGDN